MAKVAHFIAIKTTYARPQLAELYCSKIVCFHGVPEGILSDRGTQFISKNLGKVARNLGHRFELQFCLSPLHRWTNRESNLDFRGYVESLCSTVRKKLG
jgi:hypothetical protein